MKKQLSILVAVVVTLLASPQAFAQKGDLDLISPAIAPNVVLLMDTSGSMNMAMRPEDFEDPNTLTVFHDQVDFPGGFISGSFCDIGTVPTTGVLPQNEDYWFYGGSGWGLTWDQFSCWAADCSLVPSSWTCTDLGTFDGAPIGFPGTPIPRQLITLPVYGAYGNYTYYPRNYIHWVMNRVYNNTYGGPVPIPEEDRMMSAKTAITDLVNAVNVDGQPERVKFGLARFNSNSVGGFVLERAALGNKTVLLNSLATLVPGGGTPLSETYVDVGRYFAGSQGLGTYSNYNVNDSSGSVPPSPIDLECELNFIIAMTDGIPTNDDHGHAAVQFDATIGDWDGDGNGRTSDDSLADAAGYLNNTDLRPDLDGEQTIVTYTVGFAIDHPVLKEAALYGDGIYFTPKTSAELTEDLTDAIEDIIRRSTSLTSATVPSSRTAFGDGFYTAFFVPEGKKPVWPGFFEAYRLGPDLTVLDKPNPPTYPYGQDALDPNTNMFLEPRNPYWDAAAVLTDPNSTRNLLTSSAGVMVAFDKTNVGMTELGLATGDDSNFPHDPNVLDLSDPNDLADAVVDFVTGFDSFDDDDDADLTEKRDWILGDIFHSNPVVIGPPPAFLRLEKGFGPPSKSGTFMEIHEDRTRHIMVGANDGALHAFHGGDLQIGDNLKSIEVEDGYYDLGTGNERFGYIPESVLDKLALLPREDVPKQYFVDGNPTAADVWIDYDADGYKEGTDWTTMLVQGLREGGDSYTALDVSEPAALPGGNHFPYPRLMWEVESGNDLKFGQTWSDPVITRVKMNAVPGTGNACNGDCNEKWVVIVGGGYMPEGDPNLLLYYDPDPNNPDFAKSKAIYVLDAETGAAIARVEYDPSDAQFQKMKYSVPGAPAVLDLDFDGFADVVYIGDTGGQLWKWDLRPYGIDSDADGEVDNWDAQVAFAAAPVDVGDIDGDGLDDYHYKSIFYPPAAAFLDGKLVLSFASGERNNLLYEGTGSGIPGDEDDNNRFWVVYDENEPSGSTPFANMPYDEGDLTDITNKTADDVDSDKGYFFLVEDGQKFMTNHVVFAGIVLTLAYEPDLGSGVTAGCDIAGTTFVFLWNLEDGSGIFNAGDPGVGDQAKSVILGNGAPADPQVTISKDGDTTAVQMIAQTSTGEILKLDLDSDLGPPVDMVYWRQNF